MSLFKLNKTTLRIFAVLIVLLLSASAVSALPQGHDPAPNFQNNEKDKFLQPSVKFDKPIINDVREERGPKDNGFKGDFNQNGRNNDKVKVQIIARCTVLGDARNVNPVLNVNGQDKKFQKIGRGNQFIAVFEGKLNTKGNNNIFETATSKGKTLKGSQLVVVKNMRNHWIQNTFPLVSSNEGPREGPHR